MEQIRTFIAIEISELIRQKITELQEELKRHKERITWTKPANIHLTLRFLGEVETGKVQLVGETLGKLASRFSAFNFQVAGLGAFPNLRRPRVLWIGIENRTDELQTLHDELQHELNKLGFPGEKKRFNPHLTIGRVKSQLSSGFIESFKSMPFETNIVSVEEIILMQSDLHPKEAIHTPLRKLRLANNLN